MGMMKTKLVLCHQDVMLMQNLYNWHSDLSWTGLTPTTTAVTHGFQISLLTIEADSEKFELQHMLEWIARSNAQINTQMNSASQVNTATVTQRLVAKTKTKIATFLC